MTAGATYGRNGPFCLFEGAELLETEAAALSTTRLPSTRIALHLRAAAVATAAAVAAAAAISLFVRDGRESKSSASRWERARRGAPLERRRARSAVDRQTSEPAEHPRGDLHVPRLCRRRRIATLLILSGTATLLILSGILSSGVGDSHHLALVLALLARLRLHVQLALATRIAARIFFCGGCEPPAAGRKWAAGGAGGTPPHASSRK